ncbi:MAG: hypothetical protein IKE59_06030 [Erysipelotrichaceae bacterium]|nr:hypothetical protein [Erysipelotrichaceae bacterium]
MMSPDDLLEYERNLRQFTEELEDYLDEMDDELQGKLEFRKLLKYQSVKQMSDLIVENCYQICDKLNRFRNMSEDDPEYEALKEELEAVLIFPQEAEEYDPEENSGMLS